MTTQPKMTTEDRSAHREHMAWLDDCGKWRSEHRQTLATLAKVQAAIMEQEAALESHAALIQAHDMHLQEHAESVQKHEHAKEAHERLKKHHVSILSEAEKLLRMCQSGM